MGKILLFIAAWLGMMTLIGVICVAVGWLCKGKRNKDTVVEPEPKEDNNDAKEKPDLSE